VVVLVAMMLLVVLPVFLEEELTGQEVQLRVRPFNGGLVMVEAVAVMTRTLAPALVVEVTH
jgi:hypothetical protein